MRYGAVSHDEYAAYLGECECNRCREVDAFEQAENMDPPDLYEERDEALEWGGINYP
jgi:hypothetical protein